MIDVLRLFLISGLFFCQALQAQYLKAGTWQFTLSRPGGPPVYVLAEVNHRANQTTITFVNDTERIESEPLCFSGDSVLCSMPVFETTFGLAKSGDAQLTGNMTKGTSAGKQEWQVLAKYGESQRIPGASGQPIYNISGRWAMQFQRPDGSWRQAVGELKQTGNRLTGTIINPSGDYRFLEGAVWSDSLYLTAFDGAHMYAFRAHMPNDTTLDAGIFFDGTPPGSVFRAQKNAAARLPELSPVAGMKPVINALSFRFPDLDSNIVSLGDARFRNKVVIVQLMGSWCPNCMDETKFLSEFYNSQQYTGVEVVSLAYELSTDFHRSANTLRKFQQRFGVRYPMLITGARSADPDKAAKTLPQLTNINYFPTTIFIGKKGQVRDIHNGFYGPGAPDYFEAYKKKFYKTIEQLTRE
jgi:thiol-disulfide isomerase/thioredoxin